MNSQTYLHDIRYAYYTRKYETIYFILGNSSCDMDSTLSAYLLSIGKNIRQKAIIINDSNTVAFNDDAKEIYFPVINCKRGELKTRLDVIYVLKKFHIDEDDFFYMDDEECSQEKFESSGFKRKVIWVDHSVLNDQQIYLRNYVEEIYDHHFSLQVQFPNLRKKFLKYPCGSCSTLIILDYLMSKFPQCLISPLLAVTAIWIDTENFKEMYFDNRWKEVDRMVYELIMGQIQSNIDMNSYYNEVFKAKVDIESNLNLSIEDLFVKDRKSFRWEKTLCLWSSWQINYNLVAEKFGMKTIKEHIEKVKEKFGNCVYLINSVWDQDLKELDMFYLNETEFNELNLQKIEEKLKAISKGMFISMKKDAENNRIVLHFNGKGTRKSIEPIIRTLFINFDN